MNPPPLGGLPRWLSSKESACNAGDTGDMGSNPESGRSLGGRKWQPTPVFLPGKSHGQRNLAGCSLWGHRESDTMSTHAGTSLGEESMGREEGRRSQGPVQRGKGQDGGEATPPSHRQHRWALKGHHCGGGAGAGTQAEWPKHRPVSSQEDWTQRLREARAAQGSVWRGP